MKKAIYIITISIFLILAGCNLDNKDNTNDEENNTAPVVNISSHNDGDTFTSSHTVTISGTVSDDNDTIEAVSISVNGGSASTVNVTDGAYSTSLTFTSDSNEITVSASDSKNLSSSSTIKLFFTTSNFEHLITYDSGNGHDSGEDIVIAEDNSIYVCGFARGSSNYNIVITHLNSDGTLDTSFGTNGYAFLDSPAGGSVHDFGTSIDIDDSGKIVVAGYSAASSGHNLVIARYTPEGSLDTNFNSTGYKVINVSGSGNLKWETGIVAQNGKIYVADTADNNMILYKLTYSGELDTSFAGGDGYIQQTNASTAIDLTIDTNGKLLITGTGGIWRVTPDGESDTAFGSTGFVSSDLAARGIIVDSSRRILVTGTYTDSDSGNKYAAVLRYTDSGELDTTFGRNGIVTHPGLLGETAKAEKGNDLVVDALGNIYVTGLIYKTPADSSEDMVVWRFKDNGDLDITFGDDQYPVDNTPDGFFTYGTSADNLDRGKGIAIDNLGRVVISGETYDINSNLTIWHLD